MATNIELIKAIKQNTIDGVITWNNFVQNKNMIVGEFHDITPIYDIRDGTYYSYINLDHINLTINTLSARIISAGNYVLNIRQEGNSMVLDSNTMPNMIFGTSEVTVEGVYLDIERGQLQFKWNLSNNCVDPDPVEETCTNDLPQIKHGLYVDYEYKKIDANFGDLSTVYYSGNTPWSGPEVSELLWGLALINSPRSNQSVKRVKKIITFRGTNKEPDWIFEPTEGTVEFKEFNYLWIEVEKKITQYIYGICTGFPIP